MDMIFIGGFFPKQISNVILANSKRQVQNSANNFQWSFINGFSRCMTGSLQLITAPFIGWYPKYYKSPLLKGMIFDFGKDGIGVMVGFLNLPLLKNFFKYFNLLSELKRSVNWQKEEVVIVYSLDTAYLKAAIKFKKYNPFLKVCVIVPDLHEFPGDASLLYKWYIQYIEKPSFYKLLSRIDAFVVLTDKMVDFLKIENKPWVRVEGLYEEEKDVFVEKPDPETNLKTILYTGTLDQAYGIIDLIDAFQLITKANYRLVICGGGMEAKLVEQKQKNDNRISYLGILPKSEINRLQKAATILINPRGPKAEFNAYSFPSKTMEYLASGTPSLLYRLSGIPDEYYEYCYTIEGTGIKSIAEAIITVCEKSREELEEKGRMARAFILEYKNADVQCRKVLKMLAELHQ